MKKILILNTTFTKGGAAQLARDLFFDLRKNPEVKVMFAYGRGSVTAEADVFYFGNKIEFYLHVLMVRFLGLEGFGSYLATRKLIRFIEQEKFDLINIHNLHGYYINFFHLLEWLEKKNIKVAWTLHDEWLFTWLPAHSMGCEHCKTLKGPCSNTYKYPKNYLPLFSRFMHSKKRAIWSLNNIKIVAPAPWLHEQAVVRLEAGHCYLIPNGVDIALFAPRIDKALLRQKYGLPTDKQIILFPANDLNDKNKGGQYLVDLARRLEKQSCLVCVIGTAQVPELEQIRSLGYIADRAVLAELYGQSDLYCFTSAVETAPLSVLEAMASGLPIVAFQIKALSGLVTNENGKLIAYGDVVELAKNITDLLNNKSGLEILGQAAREQAVRNFSQAECFAKYRKLFNEELS